MALTVKAAVAPSKIHGLGLIAGEYIPAGTIVWRFDETIDVVLNLSQVEQLPPPARAQILNYAYRCKNTGQFILCGDDARFMNHADAPNCTCGEDELTGCTIAARDIQPGEELTESYYSFDAAAAQKF